MALVRLGHLVSAVSGTLGGTIFRQTKNGTVIARRPAKTTHNTHRTTRSKAHMSVVNTFWLSLTDEQRATWATAAKHLRFKNRLGHSRYLNGRQLYIKHCTRRLKVFDEIQIFPPINGTYPPPSPLTLEFTADAGPYTITIPTPPYLRPDMIVWGCRPHRSTLIKHWPQWTWILTAREVPDTFDCKASFDKWLGAPAQGEAVAIKAIHWETTFWASMPVITSTIML